MWLETRAQDNSTEAPTPELYIVSRGELITSSEKQNDKDFVRGRNFHCVLSLMHMSLLS